MDVVMLLCDQAQEAGGKLYVLGGGWSISRGSGVINMGLAIKIAVPWTETNRRHSLVVELLTEDGEPVVVQENPVRVEGELEVGRPTGIPAGMPLDAPMALNFTGVGPLAQGGYRWELKIDGDKYAEQSFQVQILEPGVQPPQGRRR